MAGMTTADAAPGLRERNRIRRERRVELAALRLALEHGLDGVTVEQICEASDISVRTYFNYFGTKEGALLGRMLSEPEADAVEEFLASRGSVFEDLVRLVVRQFVADPPDREVLVLRRQLFDAEPELQALQLARFAHRRRAIVEQVVDRLHAQEPQRAEAPTRERARVLMNIALSAYPVLNGLWIEDDAEAPDLDRYLATALDRIRDVVAPGS